MLTLDDLESRLKSLLEFHLIKYLPDQEPKDKIYKLLAGAMFNNLQGTEGTVVAPNDYLILMSQTMLSGWYPESGLTADLSEALRLSGKEAGFLFLSSPNVSIAVNGNLTSGEIQVVASFSHSNSENDSSIIENSNSPVLEENFPLNAFLIQDGSKVIPLNLPVLSMGRRPDNQVVIDDSRVSRTHAQLRVFKGRFVIFDLNSSGGTFVNGERINYSFLNPGDLISLAGVTFIFGQDIQINRKLLKETSKLEISGSLSDKPNFPSQIDNSIVEDPDKE